jgi:hypothetical protein|tara:strand:+ start:85 stop:354 length:270 start_codon:yes stop_codon:yes gene_type:complete
MGIQITTLPTRTENLVTFTLDKDLIPPGTGLSYPNKELAQSHSIAKALFELNGVESVWILGNSIQVSKSDNVRWGSLKAKVEETIAATA